MNRKPGRPRIDITGAKFGRLTAVSFHEGKWLCRCDCGGETRTKVSKLKSGHTKSCSCLSVERFAALNRQQRYCGACECGDHHFAVLTRGYVGLVDEVDAYIIQAESWNAHRSKTGGWSVTGTYARKLHRVICGVAGKAVDHRNGNPFDNRRKNLRACDNRRNTMNQKKRRGGSSIFKGVAWHGIVAATPWIAQIQAEGRHHYLGLFATETEAARAYDAAAIRLHGEFARTNTMLGLL